jgi:mannan endo-1,4-beta-mannosidase
MKSVEAKVITIAGAVVCACVTVCAQPAVSDEFVRREGTHLVFAGQPYRFSGPNIEWLGLEGYGPHDPAGPRFASRFEIDDALDTAIEMGGRVVRSQTMGDTVGCPRCIEPRKGEFNDAAFQSSDYALAAAGRRGMKVIVTLIGDCAACSGGGIGQYLAWEHKANVQEFFRDPALIAAYEKHVDAVLNHVNSITGVRYKDDPTILAWENCNMCGIIAALMGSQASMAEVANWVDTVGRHIKQADAKHLYLDTSGVFPFYSKALDNASPDMTTFEYYPHWAAQLGGGLVTTAATFTRDAANVTAHGKVYMVNEFGWDRTNWKTTGDLQEVLDTLAHDANVSGDLFWALQAHLDNFGFQPIPADSKQLPFAEKGECGEWWALYYPGIKTLVNSADDMAERAQQLRSHAFAMAGKPVPKHMAPAAPVITSVVLGGLVAWRGSAGAVRYSIERMNPGAKEWQTVCDRCATDSDDPWTDPRPQWGVHYRVIAWNADGVSSAPSDPQ